MRRGASRTRFLNRDGRPGSNEPGQSANSMTDEAGDKQTGAEDGGAFDANVCPFHLWPRVKDTRSAKKEYVTPFAADPTRKASAGFAERSQLFAPAVRPIPMAVDVTLPT